MEQRFANCYLNQSEFALIQFKANGKMGAVYRTESGVYLCGATKTRIQHESTTELPEPLSRYWARAIRINADLESVPMIQALRLVGWRVSIVDLDIEFVPEPDEPIEPEPIESGYPSEFVSANYNRDMMYEGQQSYHYHHCSRLNTPIKSYRGHRFGVELEVVFNSESEKDEFIEVPSNWFYRESDSSIGSQGSEIITIPLLPEDAKSVDFWKPLCDAIESHAQSWDTGCCGLHVHIGREILGRGSEDSAENLGKILYFYHHHLKDTRLNIGIYGRSQGYHENDGKTREGDAVKLLGSDVLKQKSVSEKVREGMINRAECTRYFDINIQNERTIEFRKGRGSINPQRISAVVEYNELICKYAKSTPWVQISFEDFKAYLRCTASDNLKWFIHD